jgi:hypothetical protein
MFVTSYRVRCWWQAFPVYWWARPGAYPRREHHKSVSRLQRYSQTLDYAGKTGQGQTLAYYEHFKITAIKSLMPLGSGVKVVKLF